jgi:predicted short-subunit dehydrogenase-like oxidoreductase (DUF2520 family)
MARKLVRQRSVSIIGPGNWGTSLVHALSAAGIPIPELIVPARSGRPAVKASTGRRSLPFTMLDRARLDADVLWLCVPDAAIASVTRRLVRRAEAARLPGTPLKGQIVVHSSGALSAEVLQAAASAGASVASVHPVMSFPTRTPVRLQGVSFGIEADAGSRRILNAIVRRIGGRPFSIEAGKKALYHAVGVFASPLLVSHLVAAQQAAVLAGFSRRQAQALIEPIARATLDNIFLRGTKKSFSGPIARGDMETIRLHLRALKPHPMLAGVYRSLALHAVEALPSPRRRALRRLLRSQ